MADVERQDVKSKRQLMTERLQSRYPEKDFSDDEAVFGQIYDDFDQFDQDLNGYREREKAFSDMFTSDPRSANFLTIWRNGGDPVVELVRQFGPDIKDALDDPEKQEALASANKEFLERVAENKELEDEYLRNLSESLQSIDRLQGETGMSDDDVEASLVFLLGIAHDVIAGKFSPENIQLALKAIHHDADVSAASEAGVVQGRNTKIEEKLRKPKQGDGTAPLGGSNGSAGTPSKRKYNVFDYAEAAS